MGLHRVGGESRRNWIRSRLRKQRWLWAGRRLWMKRGRWLMLTLLLLVLLNVLLVLLLGLVVPRLGRQ